VVNVTPAVAPAARVKRTILKGSAVVFAGRMAGAVLGIALNALLARLLTRDAMGGYFIAMSMVTLGSTVACLGLNRTVVKMVASGRAAGRPGEARAAVRLTFVIGTVSSLLVASVLALGPGRALATDVFDSQLVADVMPFVAGWVVAVTFQVLVAETFRGFKRFWSATLFSGLLADVFAVAVFGMLWLTDAQPGLSTALLLLLALTGTSTLVGGFFLSGLTRRLNGPGDAHTRDVLRISMPLLVVSLSSFVVGTGVDLWVVASFEPLDQVALYGAAAKLMFLVSLPFSIVSQVVPPIIAQLHTQERRSELEHALRSTATLAGIPAAAVLIVFMAAGGWILALVYGSDFYRDAATVLTILGAARLFAVYTGSCGVALTMTGHQTVMMRITLVSATLAIVLELALVQPFGIVGVAVATCIAQVAQNLFQLVSTKRHIGIWTHAELSLAPLRELPSLVRR
jgi:O-antigen/teichoic acid export membrane protein